MQQFSRSLPMMLYRALDAVMPRFRLIFNEFGLTEQQWRVLRVLWEHDEIAFSELACLTLIPRTSLVGIVDRLNEAGLARRRRSNRDRRKVFVVATSKGADLEALVMPRVAQAYADLKVQVEETSWQRLIDGLEKVSALEQGEAAPKEAVPPGENHERRE